MKEYDWKLYAIHIQECIQRIDDYTKTGQDDFFANRMAYDAVLRNLQILSESTQRLPDSIKQQFPHIEWVKIVGFRNILAHDYLGDLEPETLWLIVEKRLPELNEAMRAAMTMGEKR